MEEANFTKRSWTALFWALDTKETQLSHPLSAGGGVITSEEQQEQTIFFLYHLLVQMFTTDHIYQATLWKKKTK